MGLLHAEKMAEVALLNVFRIGFPASLLKVKHSPHESEVRTFMVSDVDGGK